MFSETTLIPGKKVTRCVPPARVNSNGLVLTRVRLESASDHQLESDSRVGYPSDRRPRFHRGLLNRLVLFYNGL